MPPATLGCTDPARRIRKICEFRLHDRHGTSARRRGAPMPMPVAAATDETSPAVAFYPGATLVFIDRVSPGGNNAMFQIFLFYCRFTVSQSSFLTPQVRRKFHENKPLARADARRLGAAGRLRLRQ